jgi:AcrR family transcriptional regulator
MVYLMGRDTLKIVTAAPDDGIAGATTMGVLAAAPPRRPRGRPTTAANSARERDLLSTAAELFGRNGFAGVSMNEISRLTGISKTTIYARFRDKAALFRAICSYACHVPGDAFREVETEGRDPRLVLADFAAATRSGLVNQEATDFLRLAVFEARRFPDIAAAILQESRSVYAPVADYLATLIKAGRITGDAEQLADHFVALLTDGYRFLLVPADTHSDEDVDVALDLFIRGIGLA